MINIAFIITNWADIEPDKSSTLRIMHECCMRKHKVYILYPNNLTVRNNVAFGFSRRMLPMDRVPESIITFYKKIKFEEKMMPLHGYDCIFIRKDPPIDPIMLNFLDSVKGETLIINDIDGLRKANNKLYTTTFHDPNNNFLPITHVSKNKEFLRRTIMESDADKMILKPLDGSGGKGVIVLEKRAKTNVHSLLDFYIDSHPNKSYVILQEFLDEAKQGDVRVLMLNGQILGAYHRVPADGEIRANISVGGSAVKYKLSDSQQSVCRKIGTKLIADGLYFVGLDLIGEKLLEVNVLNPGGITNINKLNKTKLQKKVVDFLEEKVSEREEKRSELQYLFQRLTEFRQIS